MKSQIYKETKEKLEKIKESLPYLEKAVKSRSKKQIEDSVGLFAWNLLGFYKKATEKGTSESIHDLTKKLWWFRTQKIREEKKERKYKPTKEQYSLWAKRYDKENNLLTVLEEKEINNFIDFKKLKGKDVLDFGCGTGRYTIPLAKKGAKVTGIDLTHAMIRRAKEKANEENVKDNIKFKQTDITVYEPKKKFDLIVSMLVLDHIKNLKKPFNAISKASKKGTEVVISNVHPETLRENADPETGRAQGYLIEGYKTDQFWHPIEEYVDLFREKGFVLTKIRNLIVDKKYTKMEKYKKSFSGMENKALGIIMKFKKID